MEPKMESSKSEETKTFLNKEIINVILRKCRRPGSVFGRDVNLTLEEKEQIMGVISGAEDIVQKAIGKHRGDYDKFRDAYKVAMNSGAMWLDNHIIDGGQSAQINTKRNNDMDEITVPSAIYNIHRWEVIIRSLKNKMKIDELAGTSTDDVASNLFSLGTLLRDHGRL